MQLTTTIGNLLAATLLCYTSSTLGLEKHTYRKNITIGVVIQNTDSIQTNVLKKEFRHQTSVSSTYEYLKHYKLTIVAIHLPEITYPLGTLNALCDHFIKERVVAIIFLANSENYGRTTASVQYFMHLASYTGIPIIAWNADNSGLLVNRDLNKYRLLQMAPTLEHQADAMLQILMRYNWRKFAVIVTTIAGGDYFSETCHRLIREKDLPMEIIKEFEFNTNDANELNINLKQLADSEARIILLYATYAEAKFIFEKAQKFALTDAKHMWIVTQSVVSNKFPNTNELEHLPYSFPIGMIATHFNTKSRISRETADFALFDQIRNVMEVVKSGLNSMLGAHNFSIDLASTSNCDSDFNYTWQLGDEFYKFLKNVKIKDAEPHSSNSLSIEFDTSGYLKQTYLSILNLNANRMWRKIGDYSKGVVTINDISWPGGMHRPPLGYPEKYSVKVVTLDEPPFIIASEMDHVTKTCPSKQGVKCIWASKDSPK